LRLTDRVVNHPLPLHERLPVPLPMPGRIKARRRPRDFGAMPAEMRLNRKLVAVRDGRAMDRQPACAKDNNARHLPARQAFDRSVGRSSRPSRQTATRRRL